MATCLVLKTRQMTFEIALQFSLQALEGDLLDGVRKQTVLNFHHIHLLKHAMLLVEYLSLLGKEGLLLVHQPLLQITNHHLLSFQSLHKLFLPLRQL